MYLSAERLALANQKVQETFEQCSVAWQAIPHWDTGDPSQTMVRQANVTGPPAYLALQPLPWDFGVTLAEAIAPTHDPVVAKVIANTAILARMFDEKVIPTLHAGGMPAVGVGAATPPDLLLALIAARGMLETAGYRAPSAGITNTIGLVFLSQLVNGYSVIDSLLGPSNVNSVYRVDTLETGAPVAPTPVYGYLLGRRDRIAQGGAPEASPGEEPVDIAVSVAPRLEIVGDTAANTIDLRVHLSFATRVKDISGLVAFIP
jgi:hypothetical protein